MTNKEAAEVLKRIRDGLDEMVELNNKSREAFDAALAALEVERKTGKWIPQNLNKSYGNVTTAVYFYPKCSVCGWSANNTNFCPNCGADMRGGDAK